MGDRAYAPLHRKAGKTVRSFFPTDKKGCLRAGSTLFRLYKLFVIYPTSWPQPSG